MLGSISLVIVATPAAKSSFSYPLEIKQVPIELAIYPLFLITIASCIGSDSHGFTAMIACLAGIGWLGWRSQALQNRWFSNVENKIAAQAYQMSVWVAVCLIFSLIFMLQIPPFNGLIWRWSFHQKPLYFAYPLTALPLFMVIWELIRFKKNNKSARPILLWLSLTAFLFQLFAMLAENNYLDKLRRIVLSPWSTSYFTDATKIENLTLWVANFHNLDLALHSSTHPPGPILFYYGIIQLFGIQYAPYIGGLLIGVFSSLGIWTIYFFSDLWTTDEYTKILTCSAYTIVPGLVLFLPSFDLICPIFVMLIILFWEYSLRKKLAYTLPLGIISAIALFFAYNMLAMGAFLAFSGIYFTFKEGFSTQKLNRFLLTVSIASGLIVAFYWVSLSLNRIQSDCCIFQCFGKSVRT